MGKIKSQSIERNSMECTSLEDLELAMREIRDLDDGADIQMYIVIEVPGLGKRQLHLLDDVPVQVTWEYEAEA